MTPFSLSATARERIPITTIRNLERKRSFFSDMPDLKRGFITSTDRIVLVVNRHVSAEDIIAERSAAITSPFNPTGKIWLIIVGKEASGLICGNNTLADMPIIVIIKAKGTDARATAMVALLAVFSSLAQKILEYISGPTR